MVGPVVGTHTHIPISHGSSSSNFADVLASSYNLTVADYSEPTSSGENRRVETLLGPSNMQEGNGAVQYASGHSNHHVIQHNANPGSLERAYSNSSIISPTSNHLSNQHLQQHLSLIHI